MPLFYKLKIETDGSSKMLIHGYQTIRYHNTEASNRILKPNLPSTLKSEFADE